MLSGPTLWLRLREAVILYAYGSRVVARPGAVVAPGEYSGTSAYFKSSCILFQIAKAGPGVDPDDERSRVLGPACTFPSTSWCTSFPACMGPGIDPDRRTLPGPRSCLQPLLAYLLPLLLLLPI